MAFSSILAAVAGDERPAARVLIVDDSVVARASLARMIDGTGSFVVASSVASVREALAFLSRHRVEIILLDLELPGTDGLTALPDLIAAGHGARVMVVSSTTTDGATATVQALALGAADTLVKPSSGFARRFGELLVERLTRLVDGVVEPALPLPPPSTLPRLNPFDVVAVGASTGGIHALSRLLRALPPSFTQPILITQHLPASFMPYFAAQLAVLAGRPCEVAEDRASVRAGRMLVAPGDAHLRVVRQGTQVVVRLSRAPEPSGCLPSVDPMLTSVAEVYGARGLGVMLSGMGRDGAAGARALAAAGGAMLAQDKASSTVWGMPGAVASDGGARAVLPPDEIGRVLASRASRP